MNKSFQLYKDTLCVLEDLTVEQRGDLFYAIYKYQIGEEMELSGIVKVAFSPLKAQFERDNEKYRVVCERNKKIAMQRHNTKPTTRNDSLPNVTRSTDKDKDKDKDKDNKETFTFSLSKQTAVTSLSKEYLSQLESYINKSEYSLSYTDFINGLEAKGNKYKNFKSAYITWSKNHDKWNKDIKQNNQKAKGSVWIA